MLTWVGLLVAAAAGAGGGIFGQGPGGLVPLFPVPLLHFAYDLIAYLPALIALVLVLAHDAREGAVPQGAHA